MGDHILMSDRMLSKMHPNVNSYSFYFFSSCNYYLNLFFINLTLNYYYSYF